MVSHFLDDLFPLADFLATFLEPDFLVLLLAADFWGVAWADPADWAGAEGADLLATFFDADFLIFFDPVDFLVVLLAVFFAPAGLALATIWVNNHESFKEFRPALSSTKALSIRAAHIDINAMFL